MIVASGLKGQLIELFSYVFPLGPQEIQVQLSERYQEQVSRQAIHQALSALQAESIVDKVGQKYKLSVRFIVNLENFVTRLKGAYLEKPLKAFGLAEGKSREYHATSLANLDAIWNGLIFDILDLYLEGEHPYVQQVPHAWFSLAHFEEELRISALLMQKCKQFVTVVTSNTSLDQWLQKFYMGSTSHYSVSTKKPIGSKHTQLAVLGEYILEARYPSGIAEKLDDLFSSCNQLSRLDIQDFIACVNMTKDISLHVSRNRQRARALAKRLLAISSKQSR